jgi:hypothetical protein
VAGWVTHCWVLAFPHTSVTAHSSGLSFPYDGTSTDPDRGWFRSHAYLEKTIMPSTSLFQSSIFGAPTRLEPTTHKVVCRYWSSAPHVDLMIWWLVNITNGQPSADIKWSFQVRTGATRPQTILKCRLPSAVAWITGPATDPSLWPLDVNGHLSRKRPSPELMNCCCHLLCRYFQFFQANVTLKISYVVSL